MVPFSSGTYSPLRLALSSLERRQHIFFEPRRLRPIAGLVLLLAGRPLGKVNVGHKSLLSEHRLKVRVSIKDSFFPARRAHKLTTIHLIEINRSIVIYQKRFAIIASAHGPVILRERAS